MACFWCERYSKRHGGEFWRCQSHAILILEIGDLIRGDLLCALKFLILDDCKPWQALRTYATVAQPLTIRANTTADQIDNSQFQGDSQERPS